MIAATLADKFPTGTLPAATPTFGRTGIQQLIKMFGYRFCWDAGGSGAAAAQDCPSPCAEGAPWSMRPTSSRRTACAPASSSAARKPVLGSKLAAAQRGAVNALKAGGSAAATSASPRWSAAISCRGQLAPGLHHRAQLGCQQRRRPAARRRPAHPRQRPCLDLLRQPGQLLRARRLRRRRGHHAATTARSRPCSMPNAHDMCAPVCNDPETTTASTTPTCSLWWPSTAAPAVGVVSFYPDAGGRPRAARWPPTATTATPAPPTPARRGACSHAPDPGCCTSDSQCNDSDACTTDTCNTHHPHLQQRGHRRLLHQQQPVRRQQRLHHRHLQHDHPHLQQRADHRLLHARTPVQRQRRCTTDSLQHHHAHLRRSRRRPAAAPTDAQCDDSNPCTTDTCNTAQRHLRQHARMRAAARSTPTAMTATSARPTPATPRPRLPVRAGRRLLHAQHASATTANACTDRHLQHASTHLPARGDLRLLHADS